VIEAVDRREIPLRSLMLHPVQGGGNGFNRFAMSQCVNLPGTGGGHGLLRPVTGTDG
jgi:hypothetical protein